MVGKSFIEFARLVSVSGFLIVSAASISLVLAPAVFAQGGTGRATPAEPKPKTVDKSARKTTATSTSRSTKPVPFTRTGLVDALAQQRATQASLVREVQRRGVDFDLTDEAKHELTEAGAQSELIAAVADNFRSDAISAGVLNGKAVRLVAPPYPAIARSAHVSGPVQVQVVIDENGNVIAARAVSGHPLLQGGAVAAARASKFAPTKLSGQPVKVTGIIVYNFVAQ